jgi:hypothetical protein
MANRSFIVDTNVFIAANSHSPQVEQSGIEKCQKFIDGLFSNSTISVDSNNEIFDEYFKHMNRSGQPGIGDMFVKYLYDNQCNPEICEVVEIKKDKKYLYQVFSDKPDLFQFDRSDLKFIAVYFLSKFSPDIYNACDSDWMENKALLDLYDVKVVELLEYNVKTKQWG